MKNSLAETPKPRGRPRGSSKPPEQRKSATIRVRVTAAQQAKFERLGGEQWLRERIDRARS
jgi:hypothetical protein